MLIRLKLPDEQDIGQQMLKHRRVNFHLHTSAVIHDIGKGIIKNLLAFIDGRTIIVTNYITNARLRIRVHAHDRYDEFVRYNEYLKLTSLLIYVMPVGYNDCRSILRAMSTLHQSVFNRTI